MVNINLLVERALTARMQVQDKNLILTAAEEIKQLRAIKTKIQDMIAFCIDTDEEIEDVRGFINGLRWALGCFIELTELGGAR